jgi:hypothetical protein
MNAKVKATKILSLAIAVALGGTFITVAPSKAEVSPDNVALVKARGTAGYSPDLQSLYPARVGELMAVGRVDAISLDESEIWVLGQRFSFLGDSSVQSFLRGIGVGQAVALFGDLDDFGNFVTAAVALPGQYVAGSSEVFLRARLSSVAPAFGTATVGRLSVDLTSSGRVTEILSLASGAEIKFIGIQPVIEGSVLANGVEQLASHAIVELDASVGTGRASPQGSVELDASVGTGRASPQGSVELDASVGTGRASPQGSVELDASVGTGRASPQGSVELDASVGTGRASPQGSVELDASVGTGRASPQGSVELDASVGTGRASPQG